MNAIWAVRSLGIDPATGDEIFLTKDGETTTEWKAEDQVVCGDAMPECSGTFGINMDYRGIFLNMSFYYQFGGQTYNQSFYMDDVFRASTVKTERGLTYPFARTFSFSLQATF